MSTYRQSNFRTNADNFSDYIFIVMSSIAYELLVPGKNELVSHQSHVTS